MNHSAQHSQQSAPNESGPGRDETHANQLSVSQPVDMHAHAIITAPMTNTKSEPIANLRIQGIVSSNQDRQHARHRPNENELSDRWRERAGIAMEWCS